MRRTTRRSWPARTARALRHMEWDGARAEAASEQQRALLPYYLGVGILAVVFGSIGFSMAWYLGIVFFVIAGIPGMIGGAMKLRSLYEQRITRRIAELGPVDLTRLGSKQWVGLDEVVVRLMLVATTCMSTTWGRAYDPDLTSGDATDPRYATLAALLGDFSRADRLYLTAEQLENCVRGVCCYDEMPDLVGLVWTQVSRASRSKEARTWSQGIQETLAECGRALVEVAGCAQLSGKAREVVHGIEECVTKVGLYA